MILNGLWRMFVLLSNVLELDLRRLNTLGIPTCYSLINSQLLPHKKKKKKGKKKNPADRQADKYTDW